MIGGWVSELESYKGPPPEAAIKATETADTIGYVPTIAIRSCWSPPRHSLSLSLSPFVILHPSLFIRTLG